MSAAADVPRTVAFNVRRTANALMRPIVNAAGRKLFIGVLPKELTRLFINADKAPEVDRAWVTLDVAVTVIRSDEDLAVCHDRITVSFGSKWH